MASPDTAKRHTEFSGAAFRNSDQHGSEIDQNIALIDLQAQRLSRIFALSDATAATIAGLAYSVAR
jgi:hypothetical protein